MRLPQILVFTNDASIAERISETLQHSEFSVAFMKKNPENIQAMNSAYDLIIIDCNSDFSSYLSICKSYREQAGSASIIILNDDIDPESKLEALKASVDEVFAKPVELNELYARVRALLRRPRQTVTEKIQLQFLELNTTTRIVRRDRRMILLSPKECELLGELFRNPNIVMSSAELAGDTELIGTGSNDIIRQRIKIVRRKLAMLGASDIITTVANRGYVVTSNASCF